MAIQNAHGNSPALSCCTAALLCAGTVVLLATSPSPLGREEAAKRLNFYPSLHVRFVNAQARNYFISQAQIVNVSGAPMTDLTIRQTFPSGFTPKLLEANAQSVFKRPEGFKEALEQSVYTVRLPELRIAEATTLAVELRYSGRPASVSFPGIEVEYTQSGQTSREKGLDQTWDLSKYTKYSGTLRDYLKRYAGLDIVIPNSDEDWGFTNLLARAGGKPATGPVEVESDPSGRTRFALQAGTPGGLRQLTVTRRAYDPARFPKANDEVRRLVQDQIQAAADFSIDADNIAIQKKKVGKWDAWVVDTTWRDRVKDRLGEGPSRWYIFYDEEGGSQYVVNISAQGRGPGAGKADVPAPAREQQLMIELEGMVTSLRVL